MWAQATWRTAPAARAGESRCGGWGCMPATSRWRGACATAGAAASAPSNSRKSQRRVIIVSVSAFEEGAVALAIGHEPLGRARLEYRARDGPRQTVGGECAELGEAHRVDRRAASGREREHGIAVERRVHRPDGAREPVLRP